MQSEQLKLSGTKTQSGQPENFYKLRGKCNKFGRFFLRGDVFRPDYARGRSLPNTGALI